MKPIYLTLSSQERKVPCGSSRFLGNPDLPEDVPYPMYIDSDGDEYPYSFVCQINLEEIAPYDKENLLPHKGLLLFFAKIDRYLGYDSDEESISGSISENDDVKVMYITDCDNLVEKILVDDDDLPIAPREYHVSFGLKLPHLADEHALFTPPTHREWETWDKPFEDWIILFQTDSMEDENFSLNFVDVGVLDFLISPMALRDRDFSDVRGIVLST